MRKIILISLGLLAYVSIAISQPICNDKTTFVSPVVPKPTNVSVKVYCYKLDLTWKFREFVDGYIITSTYLDPATDEKVEMPSVTKVSCFPGNPGSCSASLPVISNTEVSWTIQAIDHIDGTTFVSYPFRSTHSYLIPPCDDNENAKSLAKKSKVSSATLEENLKGELYPNPVQSTLTINFNSTVKDNMIKVFDVNGRTVITKKATTGNMQLNVSALSSGLYILQIENSKGKPLYTAKFIKE